MNRFHPKLHTVVSNKLDEYGIEVILNQRVKIPEDGFPTDRLFEIPLTDGKTLQTDLAVNSSFLCRRRADVALDCLYWPSIRKSCAYSFDVDPPPDIGSRAREANASD